MRDMAGRIARFIGCDQAVDVRTSGKCFVSRRWVELGNENEKA
jgi:hypothetical protein